MVTYYSDLTNNSIGEQERILTTLKAYLPPNDVPRATQAFLRFYTRRGPFREDHCQTAVSLEGNAELLVYLVDGEKDIYIGVCRFAI